MEIQQQNNKNRKYSVPVNQNLHSYQFFEGYLEKKARNILLGFQKRYFRCLEGKIIIYTEKKESKQLKGQIQIATISSIKSIDSKTFSFECENIEYQLKAENEQLKNKWIEVIRYLMNNNSEEKKPSDLNKSFDSIHKNNKKKKPRNSISIINKKTASIIRKYGYTFNKEDPLSNQLLEVKGITKLINIKETKIQIRMHYGIMNMRQSPNDSFSKKWLFILSERPLYNEHYNNNNLTDLEPNMLKDWLKFDNLYYFKCDKNSNDNSGYFNKIELEKSHNIINFTKDGKYYINLDIGDKVYDFYCDTKVERDEWFEVMKNSRKTAKEYQISVTKHPRNVEMLCDLYDKNKNDLIKKIDDERLHTIGNYKGINDFKLFEFTLINLQKLIESTIDGFLCTNQNRQEIIKYYSEHMIIEYLELIKLFWNKQYNLYNLLSNIEIIKISYLVLNFGEMLQKLNIDEQNLSKNGRELAKIYFNKNFQNIYDIIESILKKEREKKGQKNDQGQYFTNGPNELFEILNDAFETIKPYKHSIIYKKLLKIYYISITQYIIGVNCVITNQDLIIEDEYLISVANSSFNLIQLLNTLVDNMKDMDVLSEKEIIEEVEMKKITSYINKLTLNSIIRFVYDQKDELAKIFDNINFFDLEMMKVVFQTSQIFNDYRLTMTTPIVKRCWNEILKLTLCYYISSLLFTAKKRNKNINEIKEKIKNDKKLLVETYEPIVGENLTKATIKILEDIYNFFEVSQTLIPSSCLAIRLYIGPAFSSSAAKKLVSLRSDFSKNEKEDSKRECEEALKNYKGPKNGDNSGYFNLLGEKIKIIDKEKKILKKISEENSGNVIIEHNEINNINIDKDTGYNLEDAKKRKFTIIKTDLGDFLKDFSDGDDEQENIIKVKKNNINDDENEDIKENCEIDYEGFLHKKAFQFYKKFYFQIKNECIYMFKNKISNIILNKFPLKNVDKIIDYKEKKFIVKIIEKFEQQNNTNNNTANNNNNIINSNNINSNIINTSNINNNNSNTNRNTNNNKKYFREHKFRCENAKEKTSWMAAISKAIKKMKMNKNIQIVPKVELKEYKRVINDYFKLPNIKIDEPYMKMKVLGSLINENYFPIIPSKVNNVKKSIKKIKEDEKKLEKERKKLEGNGDKSVGSKIKNWFKNGFNSNKSIKNNDEQKIGE